MEKEKLAKESVTEADSKYTSCSCGKNDSKGEKTHCHQIERKYSTVCYCPCLIANRKCTNSCKCKRCTNQETKFNEDPVKKGLDMTGKFQSPKAMNLLHKKGRKWHMVQEALWNTYVWRKF